MSVTMACVLALCWPAAAAENSVQLFQAPIGIESVFPVSVIRDSMLTELEQVGNGYELWGQEVVTQSHISIHFSTPVAYPWEYSQEGAASLVDRLQQLSYVRSAQVEYFPSIHPQFLKHYSDLQPLAKQERIIRVTLKDWPNAHLLSFPTFTVLVFQYLDRNVSYSEMVVDWKKTIEAFRTLHELRKLLGIEPRLRWRTIPTLTWVHLHYYNTADFWNRYWSGSDRDVSDRNKQFLRENSLVSFGADDPSNRVRHCYDVSDEYFPLDDSWRFFYATGDWFLGWDDTIYVSSSSPQMTWIRIVRAALLVNVVLPEMAERSSALVEGLTRERSRLVNTRINAFGMFSLDAIDSLHAEVGRVEAQVRNTRVRQRRIKESVNGYESLLTFLARPFGGPLADPAGSLKRANEEERWECIEEFFSFRRDTEERRNAVTLMITAAGACVGGGYSGTGGGLGSDAFAGYVEQRPPADALEGRALMMLRVRILLTEKWHGKRYTL